jgi:uncharacterized protein YcnI
MYRLFDLIAGAALLSLLSVTASAHVVLDRKDAPAGSTSNAIFMVTHGCGPSPTVKLSVHIPDGVTGVKPQPKPGWTLSITNQPAEAAPVGAHGHHTGPAVTDVTWSGGHLPADNFDQFILLVRLPDKPGTVVHFPAVQECEQGIQRWVETPDPGSPDRLRAPAPGVTLLPKTAQSGSMSMPPEHHMH